MTQKQALKQLMRDLKTGKHTPQQFGKLYGQYAKKYLIQEAPAKDWQQEAVDTLNILLV